MKNSFLPKEYDSNKSLNDTSGGYMKFTTGANRFRIMGSPIVGWEWWNETKDGKRAPHRVRINEKLDAGKIDDPESVRRFWAMVVYNYDAKKIQILEITQKGIQQTLENLVADDDWGSPVQAYDIVITKTGEKMETKYEVLPKPKTEIDPEILAEYKATKINLEALYDGDDPFSETVKESTDGEEAELEAILDGAD